MDLSRPPPFPPFSVPTLLNTPPSSLLLASSGKEYARASFRSPGEVAKARKEAMGRLGLDFLGIGDEADAEMDWDKELADAGDGDSLSVTDTKLESVDAEVRDPDPDHETKPVDLDRYSAPLPRPAVVTSFPRYQDIKTEDSPVSPPNGRPMSAGSSVSFAPPPPSASSSVFDASVTRGIPISQDPPAELSARERNRLKRKRKAGTSAFVAGGAPPSGSSLTNGNGSGGPSGPPPPPKGAASKYHTTAAGESGSSK